MDVFNLNRNIQLTRIKNFLLDNVGYQEFLSHCSTVVNPVQPSGIDSPAEGSSQMAALQRLPNYLQEESTENRAASNKHSARKRNRGPKPKKMYDGNGPIQLWQLILSELISSSSEPLVEWTKKEKYEFRILQPDKLAALWGEQKKKTNMNFAKLARGLRYYYGKSILEKVRGQQFTYQFVMDIDAILANDSDGEASEGGGRGTPDVYCEAPRTFKQGKGCGETETQVTDTGVGRYGGVWEDLGCPVEASRDTGGAEQGIVNIEGIVQNAGETFDCTREDFRLPMGISWDTGGEREGALGTKEVDRNLGEAFEDTGKGKLRKFWGHENTGMGCDITERDFGIVPVGLEGISEGCGIIKGGLGEIKSFDLSVLVESNDTSSFYEAL